MPKSIRTRSSAEVFQSSSLSGHATPEAAFINNLVSAAITYTTNTVLGSVFKDSNIALPQVSSTQSALLLDIGISSDPGLFPSTAIAQSTSITAAIDEQIEQEIKDGILPDPNSVDPITGEPLEGGGDLGDVPVEDDLESQGQVTDAQLSKDTKSAEI